MKKFNKVFCIYMLLLSVSTFAESPFEGASLEIGDDCSATSIINEAIHLTGNNIVTQKKKWLLGAGQRMWICRNSDLKSKKNKPCPFLGQGESRVKCYSTSTTGYPSICLRGANVMNSEDGVPRARFKTLYVVTKQPDPYRTDNTHVWEMSRNKCEPERVMISGVSGTLSITAERCSDALHRMLTGGSPSHDRDTKFCDKSSFRDLDYVSKNLSMFSYISKCSKAFPKLKEIYGEWLAGAGGQDTDAGGAQRE